MWGEAARVEGAGYGLRECVTFLIVVTDDQKLLKEGSLYSGSWFENPQLSLS